MKKQVFGIVLTLSFLLAAVPSAWAYDFFAVSPSGHTLYYTILSGGNNVAVTSPNDQATEGSHTWDGFAKPAGDLVIPESVSHNGKKYTVSAIATAFYLCTELTSVTLPESITVIGKNAFRGCESMQGTLVIPHSVEIIEEGAFACCGAQEVIIGDGVTTIGDAAFNNMPNLKKVTLGQSVRSIGPYAFLVRPRLVVHAQTSTPATIGKGSFNEGRVTVYTPKGASKAYKKVWGKEYEYVEME